MDPFTIALLVALGGTSVVGFAMWRVNESKAKRRKEEKVKKRAQRSVRNIRLNDIVTYMGQDFIVQSIATFDERGWRWKEYLLVDGKDEQWLEVEEDDELFVGLIKEIDTVPFEGTKPPDALSYDGVRYKQVERGEASITYEGEAGARRGGRCKYFDYEGEGANYLSVEQIGETFEVYVGREVQEAGLEILPGS